jgi:hypothetical protein
MGKPIIERLERDASEAPDGWITIASVQTNGKDLGIQINEAIVPQLSPRRIASLISKLTDALYTVRPDLRPQ